MSTAKEAKGKTDWCLLWEISARVQIGSAEGGGSEMIFRPGEVGRVNSRRAV